jgi:hypothetical protein
MIEKAEIINQPYSGQLTERIYDNENAWNSQSWTWIKFIDNDLTEWCGQFRGFPREVAISKITNVVLVLTSDYLFQLNRVNGDLTKLEDQPQYHNLTVSPNGEFIVADYYHITKIVNDIDVKQNIESPIEMDMITFKGWTNSKLKFTCDEFLNRDRHLTMEYDIEANKIEIKNAL